MAMTREELDAFAQARGYTNWDEYLNPPSSGISSALNIPTGGGTTTTTPTSPVYGPTDPYGPAIPTPPTVETYGPYTQYLQNLGLGKGYQTIPQRYLANMYEPLYRLFNTSGLFGGLMGDTGNWESWYPSKLGGQKQLFSQYANIMNRLFSASPAARQEFGMTFEPVASGEPEFTSGGIPKSSYEGLTLDDLQALMGYGMANKYGNIGGAYAASRIPYMQQQWMNEQVGGGQGGTFIDYLRSKFGL